MSALDGFLNAVAFFWMMAWVEGSTNVIDLFLHGSPFPKWFPGKRRKFPPLLKSVKIPLIVIKIFMGFAYQYIFPFIYKYYNLTWTSRTRTLVLSNILLRAGLELNMKGKTLSILLMGIIPVFCEVFMVSAIGYGGFGFRYPFAVSMGFLAGSAAPGIMVPIQLNFKMRGMGADKAIPTTYIGVVCVDEIVSILGLGTAQTFAFNEVIKSQASTGAIVSHLVIEILAAIGVGIATGLLMYPLKNLSNKIKVVPLIAFACGIIFGFEAANFYESKYLASLIFGYTANKIWHENSPEHELNQWWKILSPALFGSIGADLDISKINPGVLGYTFLTVIVGLITKFSATFILCYILFRKLWTKGEMLFVASCALAKAAFQASLGSSFITLAKQNGAPEFLPMGYEILTVAILYIIIAGPAGSILAITFGNKYLSRKNEAEIVKQVPEELLAFVIDEKEFHPTTTERKEIVTGTQDHGEQTENKINSSLSDDSANEEEVEIEMKENETPKKKELKHSIDQGNENIKKIGN